MRTSLLAVAALTAATLTVPSNATAAPAARGVPGNVVLDWERTALRTIYTEGLSTIPEGTLYLGFSSLAVHNAVQKALRRGDARPRAAAAQAAHDVLTEYFPASRANLDADLATSLSTVRDGRAERRGIRIGRRAAAAMITSRVGDGRARTIEYTTRNPVPAGVWEAPETGMLAPQLGFVDPLVLDARVRLHGPDRLRSDAYTRDFRQVKRLGALDSTARSAEQTALAEFFNTSSVVMLREALFTRLETHPMRLGATARLFAALDAATADSVIQAWRHKYVARFWRPFQGIQRADEDRNPATSADATWESLLPTPPYADYVSGHGAITSPFATIVRTVLGERTRLVLEATLTSGEEVARPYTRLRALEHHAKMSRIWGGLHFGRAMDDAYRLGHQTARRVWAELR